MFYLELSKKISIILYFFIESNLFLNFKSFMFFIYDLL